MKKAGREGGERRRRRREGGERRRREGGERRRRRREGGERRRRRREGGAMVINVNLLCFDTLGLCIVVMATYHVYIIMKQVKK